MMGNSDATKKFHYVYMIEDIFYGQIYIGIRSCTCDPFEDSYMGSGYELNKRRKENPHYKNYLKKTILGIYSERSTASAVEALLVNQNFINRTDTMNLKGGGEYGSFTEFPKTKKQKQLEGVARAKAEGRSGRPAKIDKNKVIELHERGFKHAEIANELECSRPSVYRILGSVA